MNTFHLAANPAVRQTLIQIMHAVVVGVSLVTVRQIMCGGMNERFVNQVRRSLLGKVTTRSRDLFGLGPPMESHVVAEVHYNDSWHLYDATWGVVFVENQRLLSLDELLADPARGDMVKVTRWIWRGFPSTDIPHPRLVPKDWLDEVYGVGLPTIYRDLLKVAKAPL